MKAEYIVGKLEDAVQSLDKTSATLDMLVQGALSVDDATRQGCLADVKPLSVTMDVFSRDSVVRQPLSLLVTACSMQYSYNTHLTHDTHLMANLGKLAPERYTRKVNHSGF